MPNFVHLHTHSHYSLLDGLGKIPELIERAKELGMDSLAVTDHGVMYGAVEFYQEAKKAGIKPVMGVEAYVAPKSRFDKGKGARYYHLILLAENNTGWRNLLKLVTKANLEGFYYKPRVDKELLREHSEGLIALSGCLSGEINRALLHDNYDGAKQLASEYQDIFGKDNFFLEIGHHPDIPEVMKVRPEIIKLSKETDIPLVATQDIHYVREEDADYHDVLVAVQTGNQLDDDDRLTLKAGNFSMVSPEEMAEMFSDIPGAVERTQEIANRCNVELNLGQILLPKFPTPDGKDANEYLTNLVQEKLPERYPKEKHTEAVDERIKHELSIIKEMGFADYFLIVQDFVNWAKEHGIAVGPGRGSAAGSIVSYIIGITDIDPLKYDLLFERFLNPARNEMPDIDIDFGDARRDEVIAYTKEKYGEDRVAQIITFGTMAARAAVRDAGRAMGLSYGFCDKVAKAIPFGMKLKEALENNAELRDMYESDEDVRGLVDAATHLEGVARHASIHAAAVVITPGPLTDYVPLQLAPQDKDSIVTQFDMYSSEDIGLLKMDFLGLKNLTIIEDALRIIKETTGEEVDVGGIPLDDDATFDLLQEGDTTGVFQFESSGMRRYLKQLKPNRLEDLTAMAGLYRPGPMKLIPSFIARKHGDEEISYIHPQLKPILKDTYGIAIYQEQIMRIATDLAGFTVSEADVLRKAIGKKIRSLLEEQKKKMIDGMIGNGIDKKSAQEIWELVPPFAEYGFNKSHSVSYATIAYQTAYLKAHYPQKFATALLNAEARNIDRLAFLIDEITHSGLEVLPADVNASFTRFTPENENGIRFGLLAIKNVGGQIARAVIDERSKSGPFKTFEGFLARVQHKDLNKKSLESFAKAGAFDSLEVGRSRILENMDEILEFHGLIKKSNKDDNHGSLFGSDEPAITRKLELKKVRPASMQERLAWEKELLGFYLSGHPLKPYKDVMKKAKARPIEELRKEQDEKSEFRTCGVITNIQKITTKRGNPMAFVTLEDFSPEPIELLVFHNTLSRTPQVWDENNVVLIEGRMSWRDDEPKMICNKARLLEA